MSVPTATLTATIETPGGVAIQNATLTATLYVYDIYGAVYVVDEPITATSNASGQFSVALFKNNLGTEGSYYRIRISKSNRVYLDRTVQITANADLSALSEFHPYDGSTTVVIPTIIDNDLDLVADGDGVGGGTDNSAYFAAALAASDVIRIPTGTYLGSITLTSNKVIYCENVILNGSVDCTNANAACILGSLTIIPVTGSTYGMKWRKTRYCLFDDIRIGTSAVADTYDGEGLRIEGGLYNGTYYNTVKKLTVLGMKSIGVRLISDAGDTIFRIGTNHFISTAVQYCAGGVHLEGASNNVFAELSIEQCTGTVLKVKQIDVNGLSNGNHFLAFYSENPAKSTWIDTETTAVGTLINLMNTADGTTMPTEMRSATGSTWRSRDSFVVGASGLDSYGPVEVWASQMNVYAATTDTYPRQSLSNYTITSGPGTGAADCSVGRQGVGLWGTDNATSLRAGDGSDAGHLKIGSCRVISGTGSPEGVRSAIVGSLYLRTDGGAGTTLYVKQTGSGSTGWAAK